MNILVTGSSGQLGSELKVLSKGSVSHKFFFSVYHDLDITAHDCVYSFCRDHAIDVIVNCAAYTAVDKAESDVRNAFLVNSAGPAVLAECARKINALLIHFSTGYVFDGHSSTPYCEIDPASPISVYGKSKWEGEERIREIAPSYLIIRTSWLYSVYGNNFVKTMIRLGAEREQLNVVFDQIATPTHAADLAQAIISILELYEPDCLYQETYHYTNEGACSWYDVAAAIMEIAKLPCKVIPVETAHYPRPALRPNYSVLNNSAIERDWGLEFPDWKTSLTKMLKTHLP